jgi:hypothetical protein
MHCFVSINVGHIHVQDIKVRSKLGQEKGVISISRIVFPACFDTQRPPESLRDVCVSGMPESSRVQACGTGSCQEKDGWSSGQR